MGGLIHVASDPGAERLGVWHPYVGGMWLRIARLWNVEFDAFWAAELEAARDAAGGELQKGDRERLMQRASAHHVLKDWALVDGYLSSDLVPSEGEPVDLEGPWKEERTLVVQAKGVRLEITEVRHGDSWFRLLDEPSPEKTWKAMPIVRYTPELGVRLFADERYRDLYGVTQTLANQSRHYSAHAVRETLGN